MGIFDTLKHSGELKKLEAEVKKTPSPLGYANLAEKYLSLGKVETALETIRQAFKLYPTSGRIAEAYRHIMGVGQQDKILALEKKLSENPISMNFTQLALMYHKELGEMDKALELCRQGLARYPEDENLHLLNGQIRYERFHYEGFLAQDVLKAIEHFDAVIRLNHLNYKALLLLVKIYVEMAAFNRATTTAELILRFAPGDEYIYQLKETIKREMPRWTPSAEEDIETLAKDLEKRGFLTELAQKLTTFYQPEIIGYHTKPLKPDYEKMANLVKNFDTIEGFQSAAAFETNGRLLTSVIKPPPGVNLELTKEQITTLLSDIARTALEAVKRMDIGAIKQGILTGPVGQINFFRISNIIVCILTNQTAKQDKIKPEIDWFLDMMSF